MERAQIFIADVKKWEGEVRMPNLVLLQLPSDHTNGSAPGTHTPKAMVADNGLALGQIVEALSKSPFWKKMAIFVVEDDAQNGVDHVDGHRTTALAISPYIRRGSVDSTFYAHQSMLKTIELILGLPIDTPDAAPTERLNRIVWRQVKGVKSPYPRVRQAVFSALTVDIDDEDRER